MTQSEVGNDYIAACFQETEGEGQRDTASTAGNQSGLAFEIAKKHDDFGMKCEIDVFEMILAEMTGKKDEANLCTEPRGTSNTAVLYVTAQFV